MPHAAEAEEYRTRSFLFILEEIICCIQSHYLLFHDVEILFSFKPAKLVNGIMNILQIKDQFNTVFYYRNPENPYAL